MFAGGPSSGAIFVVDVVFVVVFVVVVSDSVGAASGELSKTWIGKDIYD